MGAVRPVAGPAPVRGPPFRVRDRVRGVDADRARQSPKLPIDGSGTVSALRPSLGGNSLLGPGTALDATYGPRSDDSARPGSRLKSIVADEEDIRGLLGVRSTTSPKTRTPLVHVEGTREQGRWTREAASGQVDENGHPTKRGGEPRRGGGAVVRMECRDSARTLRAASTLSSRAACSPAHVQRSRSSSSSISVGLNFAGAGAAISALCLALGGSPRVAFAMEPRHDLHNHLHTVADGATQLADCWAPVDVYWASPPMPSASIRNLSVAERLQWLKLVNVSLEYLATHRPAVVILDFFLS